MASPFLDDLEKVIQFYRENLSKNGAVRFNPTRDRDQAILDNMAIDDYLEEEEPEVESPRAADIVGADMASEAQAEVPELEDTDRAELSFLEAMERQMSAPTQPANQDVTKVAKQRERADTAATERKEQAAAELAELEKGYEEAYDDIQSVRQGATDTAEAKAQQAEAQQAEEPEAAKVDPKLEEDRAIKLFETTHGGSFDPNSGMDKTKMDVIKQQMAKNPDLLTMGEDEFDKKRNQFALSIYRL